MCVYVWVCECGCGKLSRAVIANYCLLEGGKTGQERSEDEESKGEDSGRGAPENECLSETGIRQM